MRKVSHFSRMPQSGGVQNKDNVRTVSQFSALGLRKVTTVSRICPSWRFDLVDFATGVARMLVSGSQSLPAKGWRFQRLSPVAAGCRQYSLRVVHFLEKVSVLAQRGPKNSKNILKFPIFFRCLRKSSFHKEEKMS